MKEIFQGADDSTLRSNIRAGLESIEREMLSNFTVQLQVSDPPGMHSSVAMVYFRPSLSSQVSNIRDAKNYKRKGFRLKYLEKQWDREKEESKEIKRLDRLEEAKNKLKCKQELESKRKSRRAYSRKIKLEKERLKKIEDKAILSAYKEKNKQYSLQAKENLLKFKQRYIEITNEESN